MFISEFHSNFTSAQEGSRLFDALRRVSRLEMRILRSCEVLRWPEWPPIDPEDPGLRPSNA